MYTVYNTHIIFCILLYHILHKLLTIEQLLYYSFDYRTTNHPPRHLFEISVQFVVFKILFTGPSFIRHPKKHFMKIKLYAFD